MINGKANEITEKHFESLINRYRNNLETLMKGSGLVFNFVQLLCYTCHKINLDCGGSYIGSHNLIKSNNEFYQ